MRIQELWLSNFLQAAQLVEWSEFETSLDKSNLILFPINYITSNIDAVGAL